LVGKYFLEIFFLGYSFLENILQGRQSWNLKEKAGGRGNLVPGW
jgi:hypothetical protein